MNRVFIKTYGCQMNERDSEAVAFKLKARGYENLIDGAGGFKAIKESEKVEVSAYVCPSTLL